MRLVFAQQRVRFIIGVLALLAAAGRPAAASTEIFETGSTLLYPVMSTWMEAYRRIHGDERLDARGTGSGAGIADAMSGAAQIGASDAYLNDEQLAAHLINIPLAVSAQEVFYNIPELHAGAPLRLSGPVLAGIYSGEITDWSDRRIAAINPGVALPKHKIHPIHRAESSGDTFLFTHFLSLSTPQWNAAVHYATHVKWPAHPAAYEAVGNGGMIEFVRNVPYSLAYVGISYRNRALAAGLDSALLQNRDGAFVSATPPAIDAAVAASMNAIPGDGRISMVFAPGPQAYPIVNIEYAVVRADQTRPGEAAALRDFLSWAVSPLGGNDASMLGSFHFEPLPDRVRAIALRQIASIKGP